MWSRRPRNELTLIGCRRRRRGNQEQDQAPIGRRRALIRDSSMMTSAPRARCSRNGFRARTTRSPAAAGVTSRALIWRTLGPKDGLVTNRAPKSRSWVKTTRPWDRAHSMISRSVALGSPIRDPRPASKSHDKEPQPIKEKGSCRSEGSCRLERKAQLLDPPSAMSQRLIDVLLFEIRIKM